MYCVLWYADLSMLPKNMVTEHLNLYIATKSTCMYPSTSKMDRFGIVLK